MNRTHVQRLPAASISIAACAYQYLVTEQFSLINWNLTLYPLQAVVGPSLAAAKADDKFQFERHGYFAADRVDHAAGKPVFNLAVGLKDS